MRRAALYLRVSTVDQTTANQERELRQIAGRMACKIIKVYRDHGISGAKGRAQRPGLDHMLKDASRRTFDVVMCWAIDRLGRSLIDLLGTIQHLEAVGSTFTWTSRRRWESLYFRSPAPLPSSSDR